MARPRRPALNPRLAEFRRRLDLTQEQVAERIGITPEMVRRHERGLARPSEPYRQRYTALYRASESTLGLTGIRAVTEPAADSLDSIEQTVAEISESETSDGAIELLDRGTESLTQLHVRAPARKVLREVLRLRSSAHDLLQRPIRLRQSREVYRIESELLAHSCMLLSDLKLYDAAYRHGTAGLTFAVEAGCSEAVARSALAKSLRWEERLLESAEMARAGYERSPAAPIRQQLASYEANAAALLGDASRARTALLRVEDDAASCGTDAGGSVWSFPTPRRAIFALSVANQLGDPAAALDAAAMADLSWADGEPVVMANWAQIRIGAGIAHVDQGDLDAAVGEVRQALDLPPELRVATVTAYAQNLGRRLRKPHFRTDKVAGELLRDLRDFTLEALPSE
jgi:transcriptional regulator with XRE-family HTH domain